MEDVRKNDRYYFDEVSSDVISSILSRLPTKTCLKCKLVCREWYEIIISNEFADLRSCNCSYSPIILYDQSNFMLLDIDKSASKNDTDDIVTSADAVITLFKPKLNTRVSNNQYAVVNECNGLILLTSWRQWDPFVICNLLTSEQVIVEQCARPCLSVVDYGLGCCPVSSQFKVLRVLQNNSNGEFQAEIQTLGSNEWRRVAGDAPQNFNMLGIGPCLESGAFLHGSFHRYSSLDNSIWSFHFGKEQFCQVPTLDDMKRGSYKCLHVFDFSCLVLTSVFTELDQLCEIWMMKEYGVKDSWVRHYVIETQYWSPTIPMMQMNNGQMLFSHYNTLYLGACSDEDITSWKTVKVEGVCSFQEKLLGVCNTFKVMAPCHVKFHKLLSIDK